MTEVYLEVGKRMVFACACWWPGWCRAGRAEDKTLAALAAATPRYAAVCARAGISFDAPDAGEFEIAERVVGTATTDFGALDAAPAVDGKAITAQQAERVTALTVAAWDLFEETAAAAPAELRKGPRGGGRDRDAMIAHVHETEVLHARMLGLLERPFAPDRVAVLALRARILAEIGAQASDRPVGDLPRARRPAWFVARRTAWHALDHAWEMQDRQQ
jgi:hypothetical protein